MAPWLTNSSGKKDAILTMLFGATLATLAKYLLEGLNVGLGTVPAFDHAGAAILIGVFLTAYVARRNGLGNPASASSLGE